MFDRRQIRCKGLQRTRRHSFHFLSLVGPTGRPGRKELLERTWEKAEEPQEDPTSSPPELDLFSPVDRMAIFHPFFGSYLSISEVKQAQKEHINTNSTLQRSSPNRHANRTDLLRRTWNTSCPPPCKARGNAGGTDRRRPDAVGVSPRGLRFRQNHWHWNRFRFCDGPKYMVPLKSSWYSWSRGVIRGFLR